MILKSEATNNLKIKISNILSKRERLFIKDEKCVSASVLIPIFIKDNEYNLLFTKRSELVETHKGQISFPGGVWEEKDETFEETAIRETYEEVGIEREDIDIVDALDDVVTGTGYIIYPLIGFIPYPYDFLINRDEVDVLIEVPINFLLDEKNYSEDKNYIYKGKPYHYSCFTYKGHKIWGTTARIVKNFLTVIYNWRV